MAKFEIRADIAKNRIYFKPDGFFTDAEAVTFCEKVIQEAKKLRTPFDTISDLSGFKPASPQGFENFKQTAGELVKMGVRKTVRVESASGLGAMQFNRISKTAGYEVTVVKSLEEAEKLLDSLE